VPANQILVRVESRFIGETGGSGRPDNGGIDGFDRPIDGFDGAAYGTNETPALSPDRETFPDLDALHQ
jgi:hypothetical protein